MKKIILLVEDLEEERTKAKEAAINEGFKFVMAATLDDAKRLLSVVKVDGIVTDLHFPQNSYDKTNQPCGLAVVTAAISIKIPVAICTNIDHHFADYIKEVVKFLETICPFKKIPFTMDSKDWQKAIRELKNLLERKEG
jgi:DNA-binding NtrC family response regulator